MIVVICGPPGVGKTTVVSGVRRRLEARGGTVRAFRSDDFSSNTYQRLYAQVAVTDSTTEGADAVHIVDGTFYKREWQRAFRTLADVRFVVVTASLETCLERNRSRESAEAIDERGVHVVFREFDPPAADLEIDTDEWTVEEAVDRIVRAIDGWR